jgi:CBS domain containing-hemolysin-like protein
VEYSVAATLWRLGGLLALVFANGFFVAAEFSIVTVRKTRIDQLIAEGHRWARPVRRAVTNPDPYIAATQLGITMASIGLGWIGEPALASMLQPLLGFVPAGMAEATAHSIASTIAFAIVTALHIVLGELAPKTIALEKAEATAMVVVKPTELFMKMFWPFIFVLNGTGRAVVKLLGLHSRGGHALVHSEQELMMLVTASQEAGVLEEHEEQMLHRVFGFADLSAGKVMVPRTELVAVPATAARDELITQIAGQPHTRLPVYRRDLDDVIGMLHLTDLVQAIAAGTKTDAASLAREVVTVPETLRADDLLAEMKRRHVREAIVIDEYGGTAGLVTFESLMERIVGEIPSEAGPGAARIVVRSDGSADIDGLVLVSEVNSQFAMHIDEEVYNTVGGFVLGSLGRAPRLGDTIKVDSRRMQVTAVDGLRVARVWLSKPEL